MFIIYYIASHYRYISALSHYNIFIFKPTYFLYFSVLHCVILYIFIFYTPACQLSTIFIYILFICLFTLVILIIYLIFNIFTIFINFSIFNVFSSFSYIFMLAILFTLVRIFIPF